MKKFITVFLSIIAVICCICMAACGADDGIVNGGNVIKPAPDDTDVTHTHAFGEWIVTKSAKCTEEGEQSRYCACGEVQTIAIGVLGHDLQHHDGQAATCTKSGWVAYNTCTRCNYTTYEEISALGHDLQHHDGQAATETEDGWEEYETCSRCDYTNFKVIPALKHNIVEHSGKAATCTEDGYEPYVTCTDCDYTTFKAIPALGHDLQHHDGKVATCTEHGWEAYETCSRCDYTTYEEIPTLGHNFKGNYTFDSSEHWHVCVNGCGSIDEKIKHNIVDGKCLLCEYYPENIFFNTLKNIDEVMFGKVSNSTQIFSFIEEVKTFGNFSYTVCIDLACVNSIPSKTVSLDVGDNFFYILASDGNNSKLYTVNIRRRPVYEVVFQDNDGTVINKQNIEEDQSVNCPKDIIKTGYDFKGWLNNEQLSEFPYSIVCDSIFTASYAAKTFKLTLDVNGGNNLNKTDYIVTYGQPFKLITPTREGYEFNGWYNGDTEIDESEWLYAEDKTFTASWLALNYNVTVNHDNEQAGSVTGEGEYQYDSDVTLSAIPNEGYNFVGWFDGDDNLITENATLNFTMGLDVVINVKWNFFTVSTTSNNESAGTYSVLDNKKISIGESVTLTAATASGYTWLGWYCNENLLTLNKVYTFVMDSEDMAFTAKWSKVTLCKNIDKAGDLTNLNGTYSYGDQVLINATLYLGYTFIGWYFDETKLTEEQSLTITMTEEDPTYTARYDVEDAISNFTFESTQTTCTITGVINKSVTQVTIPSYVTGLTGKVFDGCNNLEAMIVDTDNPNYYSAGNCLINNESKEVIAGCKNSVIPIANSVTSIGIYAFYNCIGITQITIPNNIVSIGNYAFQGCTNLVEVNYKGSLAAWCNISFSSNPLTYADNLLLNGEKISGEIILPDTVVCIPSYTFKNSEITGITIPDSVTQIGDYAFQGCTGITNIIIPDSVISLGTHIFDECSSLENFTVPFVPKNFYIPLSLQSATIFGGEIYSNAFNGKTNLSSITIGSRVTSIGEKAFWNCTNLETIYWNATNCSYVGTIKTNSYGDVTSYTSAFEKQVKNIIVSENVTSIGQRAFADCKKLENVYWNAVNCSITGRSMPRIFYGDINNVYIGEKVVNIPPYLFYNVNRAEELVLPNSVQTIGDYAFYGSEYLTELELPNNLVSIGECTFVSCTSLISLKIKSIEKMGQECFAGCGSLKEVYISDNVKAIGSSAFYNCISIESMTIPFVGLSEDNKYPLGAIFGYASNSNGKQITQYGYYGTKTYSIPLNLKSITITGNVVQGLMNFDDLTEVSMPNATTVWASTFEGCTNIETATIPAVAISYIPRNSLKTVVITCGPSIGDSAFEGCGKLTSVTIPDSITFIGNNAFENCTSLTSIALPESVISIGNNAFKGCVKLASIIIPNGGTSISNSVFESCGSLTNIVLPDSLTSIGNNAFQNCISLVSINIPYGVTSIGNSAFQECSKLTSILIPDSVTSIGNSVFESCGGLTSIELSDNLTSIGSNAFLNCIKLTSIKIPDDVKSIGENMFFGNSSLTSVTIGTGVTSIGYKAFAYCTSLTSIIIPDSVTSIDSLAFYYCSELTIVVIGKNVTTIGGGVFLDSKLGAVCYKGSAEDWLKISIRTDNNTELKNATMYYYSETNPYEVNASDSNRYWHYAADGVTPVSWKKEN